MFRAIVADDEPLIRMDIIEILEANGYQVLGEAEDGYDAIEQCRLHSPDFILMDIKMPLMDGLEAAAVINKENLAGFIILLTAYSDKSLANRAVNADVMSFLTKPVDENSLIPAVEIAINKYRKIKRINQEYGKAKTALENRKQVDRAKGLLMDKKGMSEQEAYDYLRKIAMSKETTIAQIAKTLIEALQ